MRWLREHERRLERANKPPGGGFQKQLVYGTTYFQSIVTPFGSNRKEIGMKHILIRNENS